MTTLRGKRVGCPSCRVYGGGGGSSSGSSNGCDSGGQESPYYSNAIDIDITDAPLTFQPYPAATGSPVEGGTATVGMGLLIDSDPDALASDFAGSQAEFSEPNGSSAALQFAPYYSNTDLYGNPLPPGSSTFVVQAAHTFAEEGSYTANVTINDDGGSSNGGSVPIKVADATFGVSVSGPAGAVEGQPLDNVVVGQVTDSNPNAPVSDFSGTIDWGDGPGGDDGTSTSAATFQAVPGQPGVFNILGSHTYTEEGGYDMVVTVDDAGGAGGTSSGMFTIGDASIYLSPVTQVSATEGQSTGTVTVATLTDTNPKATLDDFPAGNVTINWGDGNSSNATLTAQGGGTFLVQGAHTFAEEGPYTITVNATDTGGSTAKPGVTSTYVADAALHLSWSNLGFIEGAGWGNQTIAILTDDNPNAPVGDFAGTVSFGDGHTGALSFTALGGGTFGVVVSQDYMEEGNYTLSVHITDAGGSHVDGTAIAHVADAPLDAVAQDNITTPATSLSCTVANFTDTDPNGSSTDGDGYYATIDWGDGSPLNTAVCAPAANNSWDVRGTHTYTNPGVYTLTVTAYDGGGASDTVQPRIAVVPNMQVATIDHNAVSGHLSHAEETSPGAFVPLDNNDWDYNGNVDMVQSGPVTGDQYLLPVTLPALTGATSRDGYTLTVSSGIKVFLGSDRSSPYTGQVLPATSDQTVYVEGVQAGGVNAAETLTENFSLDQTSKSNLDAAKVIVFTLNGALDVPGGVGANYDYTCDLTTGAWVTPDGGTITGGSNTAGANGSDAVINWNNTPQVGYGLYQINSHYTWGIGVNVVQVTVTAGSVTPPTGIAIGGLDSSGNFWQVTAPGNIVFSNDVTITGPLGGRGISHIRIGYVQDDTSVTEDGFYSDGSKRTGSLDGHTYVDYANGSTPPWSDSSLTPGASQSGNNWIAFFQPSQNGQQITLKHFDNPALLVPSKHGTVPLSSTNLYDTFLKSVVAQTADTMNGASSLYVPLAQVSWQTNYQGLINNGVFQPSANQAITASGTSFTVASSGQPMAPMVTSGQSANSAAGGETWRQRGWAIARPALPAPQPVISAFDGLPFPSDQDDPLRRLANDRGRRRIASTGDLGHDVF